MPTANYSCSLYTQRQRNSALYNANKLRESAVNAGTSVLREQPSTQLNEVVIQRHETRGNSGPVNGSGCDCSVPVQSNPGGDNSANVQ